MARRRTLLAAALTTSALLAGCSGGGGGGGGGTTPASPPADAPVNPAVQQGVTEYRTYVQGQIDEMIAKTTVLTDAVRAGDLAAAQAAYAPSRAPWERVEPIAGLVEEIDGAVDSRVDDFAGVDDPEFTGWHRLEYILFAQNTTEGGAPFADQLDADLQTLRTQFPTIELPPVEVAVGASELVEEVSQGKITGEEDRYSKADLWDIEANLDGSRAVVERLGPALEQANPALLAEINAGFAALDATLAPLRDGDGWVLYCLQDDQFPSPLCPAVTVPPATVDSLKAQLAALSESTSRIAGTLDLR
jgi:iron uptake system component EfeO